MDTLLHGYEKQYVTAVDGKRMTQLERDRISPHRTRPMSPGEVGVFLSHREVWKITQHLPENGWALILEDDVSVAFADWYDYLRNAIQELPRSYGLLYLQEHSTPMFYDILGPDAIYMFPQRISDQDLGQYTVQSGPRLGAYAYCINKKGSTALLHHTKEMQLPLDVQWQLPQVRQDLEGVAATRKALFVASGIFPSTI